MMKGNLAKLSTFLLTLIFHVNLIFAQGVEENTEMRNFLNHMFSTLDKTKVPDGLLRDYSFELVELDKYSGAQINNNNLLDRPTYEMFLRTIKSAAVGTAPFADIEAIMVNHRSAGASNVVSLSAAAYRYAYIKANAKDDQLINFSNGQVSDNTKNGVWQNPYASANALGFAPHDSIFNASSLTFKLNSNVWFSNMSYNKIEVDAGDGTGYKQIALGGTIAASYPSSGKKEIKLRVTLTGGNQLVAHSNIIVNAPSAMMAFGAIPNFYHAGTKTGAAYNGISTSADVYVVSRNGGQIRKPFIVVEGFDPRSLSFMVDTDPNRSLKGKGVSTIETFLGELYNPNNSAGATIAAEYDLIYVDFVQSDEYIQANAHTLKEVINWVNQQKSYAGSTEPNVIMGQSMGGLITRYALKKMESQGIPHQTSVYVSHDAPHLGANIPLGILYTVYAFNSFLENKSNLGGIVNSYGGSYIDLVKRIMHSNAARQMLVNYVDFGGHLNNTDHNLWQQDLAAVGFPQGDPNKQFRMLSIVNGSYVSSPKEPYIVDANINANSPLLDLLGGINGIFMGILVQDLWAGLLTVLPGKTQLMIKMQMLPGTAVGTKISDFEVKYVKKFLWTVPITRTLFSYQKNMPNGLLFDTYPSSKYSIAQTAYSLSGSDNFKSPILLKYGYDVKVAQSIPFVPASSALAVGSGLQPLTAAMFTSQPNIANTPFGGNTFINNMVSTGHITFANPEAIWLLAQLKYAIDGPKLGKTGSQYQIINPGAGSITWGTSNPNMATINSSGILTVTGKGVLDITATINGATLTTRIAVGTPRFVLADVVRKPGFYTIKANCIDTEPGYAEFIHSNNDLLVYKWGVKNEDGPIEWFDSESSEVKLGTTEDNDNTTIYLKVKDSNGNESAPIFVRITGYDVYDLIIKSWIVNNKGEVFTSTGTKVNYNSATMPILKRNTSGEYANARWNPSSATIVNEEGNQRGILWSPNGYIKHILPAEELERLKTFPNNQVLVYRLMLLNFDQQIIQKTPFTIIYKENYPN